MGFGRRIAIELERTFDAPMHVVCAGLRDYRAAQTRGMDERFADYVVHEGGVGAGTVISYRLRLGRLERAYELAVEEPTPNRQLRERDRHAGLLTTWTLTPAGDGDRTLVRVDVLRDSGARRPLRARPRAPQIAAHLRELARAARPSTRRDR